MILGSISYPYYHQLPFPKEETTMTEGKLYFNHDLKSQNHAFMFDLRNVLAYMKFMESRDLTGLEEQELQECLESMKKDGFENVVKALGF